MIQLSGYAGPDIAVGKSLCAYSILDKTPFGRIPYCASLGEPM